MTKYSLSLSNTHTHTRVCAHTTGGRGCLADIFQPQGCHFCYWQHVTHPHAPFQKRRDQGQKYIHILVLTSFGPPSQTKEHAPSQRFLFIKDIFHSINACIALRVRVEGMTRVISAFVQVTLKSPEMTSKPAAGKQNIALASHEYKLREVDNLLL